MLKGKNVLLGVSGGIAAFKAAALASALVKQHADINVVMTKHAEEFITPLTFDALTHHRTVTDTFDRQHSYEVEHIALADRADLFVIAPATANVIGKLANGIADDMLTTTAMACICPKIICPAMNTKMYENPATQRNLRQLREDGWEILEPESGMLACGTTGKGRMVEPAEIVDAILLKIALPHDLAGKKIMVSAGPTQEAFDPVRYVSNHSTGKMGYAIARNAALRGADVTLVSGPVAIPEPPCVHVDHVVTAEDMFETITSKAAEMDMIIMAAAIADFRPPAVAEDKIKKGKKEEGLVLEMERTRDILAWLGEHRQPGQLLCGFSMETKDMLENSKKKLYKKHIDMIAANNLKDEGAGFGVDTNLVTLITRDGEETLPLMSKFDVAGALLTALLGMK